MNCGNNENKKINYRGNKHIHIKTTDLISFLSSDLDLSGIDEISFDEVIDFYEECERLWKLKKRKLHIVSKDL